MLPESWIDRIFSRMEGRYGSLFLDRWKGCDIGNVKATWREELSGFADKPECIGYALKSLGDEKFPPTLPEFIAACRRAPRKDAPMLEHKPTPEEQERAKEFAHQVSEVVKAPARDDLYCWRFPKSQKAMDMIADAKKHPSKFRALAEIFDMHVKNEVCNEAGKLLHRWDGMRWVKA